MEKIIKVVHWFSIQKGTLIRVFGSFKKPHAFPKFVTDKLLLQEFCYQMSSGFSKTLSKGKKKAWPTLPLTVSANTVKDFKEVEAEAEQIK